MDRAGLAHFLRSARARITPQDVGLEPGHLRRTPGLRREEVARLAAVSVDTYTRLEQARGAVPSVAVLEGLARALRLGADERAHLFHLAGHSEPPGARASHTITPAVLHLLDRMDDTAAFVLDAAGYVLAWNPLAAALIADFSCWPPRDRNLTWQVFCGTGGASASYSAQASADFAQECVADLRAAAARYPSDPAITGLVRRLLDRSETFAGWWDEHEVRQRRGGHKRLSHPAVGDLDLDYDVFLVPDQDQRVIIYSAPPGSPSAEALRLLAVLSTQDMGAGPGPGGANRSPTAGYGG
jgi:transcriptional regulator with XRE-family HTH domain